MGLDMYLMSLPKIDGLDYQGVHYVNVHFRELEVEQSELFEKIKPHIKHFEEFGMSWDSIMEKVAYWRKANQIHGWFVDNLHNGIDEPCFTVQVSEKDLQELYNHCLKVYIRKENPRDTLPVRPGCFFGNYGYDEFYYKEITETLSLLDYLLKNFNFETHYLMYQCTW